MSKNSERKNTNLTLKFWWVAIWFLFILLLPFVTNLKQIFFSRATGDTINLKIKIQGEYQSNQSQYLYIKLFNDNQINLRTYPYKITKAKEGNIFEIKLDVSNLDMSKQFSLWIQPKKGVATLFCNLSQTGSQCDKSGLIFAKNFTYDLTFTTLLLGDIYPKDGQVNAGDLSQIRNFIFQRIYDENADLNNDGVIDSQDYSLALYSLGKNAQDDKISWEITSPTPTTTPTASLNLSPTVISNSTKSSSNDSNSDQCHYDSQQQCIEAGCSNCIPCQKNAKKYNCSNSTSSDNLISPTPTTTNQSCPQLDSNMSQYKNLSYPSGITSIPKTNNQILAFDGKQAYSLPYRNPNCTVSQNNINEANKRMSSFYPVYFKDSTLLKNWQIVQEKAKKYNFNPIFVIALWIEESAASGASNATPFGCDYLRNPDGSFTTLKGTKSDICTQMQCLFVVNNANPANFAQFACSYQWGQSNYNSSNNRCIKEPSFTKALQFWYNILAQGQPQECQIKYCPNAPGC